MNTNCTFYIVFKIKITSYFRVKQIAQENIKTFKTAPTDPPWTHGLDTAGYDKRVGIDSQIPPAATTQILSMTRRQTIDSHRHDVLRAIIKYQQPRLAFWAAITDTVSPRMILEETAIPSSVATMLFESSLAGANLEPTFRTMILDAAHT